MSIMILAMAAGASDRLYWILGQGSIGVWFLQNQTIEESSLKTDRSTRWLLLAIALGLWANFFWSILPSTPSPADVESELGSIRNDLHASYSGSCANSKIC